MTSVVWTKIFQMEKIDNTLPTESGFWRYITSLNVEYNTQGNFTFRAICENAVTNALEPFSWMMNSVFVIKDSRLQTIFTTPINTTNTALSIPLSFDTTYHIYHQNTNAYLYTFRTVRLPTIPTSGSVSTTLFDITPSDYYVYIGSVRSIGNIFKNGSDEWMARIRPEDSNKIFYYFYASSVYYVTGTGGQEWVMTLDPTSDPLDLTGPPPPPPPPVAIGPVYKNPGTLTIGKSGSNITIDGAPCTALILKRGTYTFDWDNCNCNTVKINAPTQYVSGNQLNTDTNIKGTNNRVRDFLQIGDKMSIGFNDIQVPIYISFLDDVNIQPQYNFFGYKENMFVRTSELFNIGLPASTWTPPPNFNTDEKTYYAYSRSDGDPYFFTHPPFDPITHIAIYHSRGIRHYAELSFFYIDRVNPNNTRLISEQFIPNSGGWDVAFGIFYDDGNRYKTNYKAVPIVYEDGSMFILPTNQISVSSIPLIKTGACDSPSFSNGSPSFAFTSDSSSVSISVSGSNYCTVTCSLPSGITSDQTSRTMTPGSAGATTGFTVSGFSKEGSTFPITITLTNATNQSVSTTLQIVDKPDLTFSLENAQWNNTTSTLSIPYTTNDSSGITITSNGNGGTITTTSNPIQVTGLIPGQPYRFSFTAVNNSSRLNTATATLSYTVPKDCELSPWAFAPSPDIACGTTTQRTQVRTVTSPAIAGGSCSDPTSQSVPVTTPDCPPPVTAPSPSPTFSPAPEPSAFSPAPEPSAFAPAPEPAAFSPAPEPSAFSPAPEPSAFSPAPEPSAFSPAPEPSAFSPAPEPSAFSPAPEPSAFSPAPEPSAIQPPSTVNPQTPPSPSIVTPPTPPAARVPTPIASPAPGMVPFSPPGFLNWYTTRKETTPITFTKRSNNAQITVKYVYDTDGRGWRQVGSNQTSFFRYAVNFADKSASLTYQDTGKVLQTKILPS